MKIALPVADEKLCMHFGHCQVFEFFEVDEKSKKVIQKSSQTPPPHEPGVLPRWIKEQEADLVIAGGMGASAQKLFKEAGIKVITGAPAGDPTDIVESYLQNSLETGENACDH